MICMIDSVAYVKPFVLGLFFGGLIVFLRLRKPRCYKIEWFTKARFH